MTFNAARPPFASITFCSGCAPEREVGFGGFAGFGALGPFGFGSFGRFGTFGGAGPFGLCGFGGRCTPPAPGFDCSWTYAACARDETNPGPNDPNPNHPNLPNLPNRPNPLGAASSTRRPSRFSVADIRSSCSMGMTS